MKCSFLDYIQLLMIGRAIWAKNIDQNTKKQKRPPKTSKNKMFIFGLCSTSDDWLSDPSKKLSTEIQKNEKGPLSHWKMKCSFLDYVQLLMIGWAIWAKNVDRNTKKSKKCPLRYQKIKCSFLDYIQLLMIGQAIWAKNIDQNTTNKKGPLRHQKIKCSFFLLHSTSDDRPSDLSKKHWPKCKKLKKAP